MAVRNRLLSIRVCVCIAHRGMAGVTLGNEVFTDLDFADDVALLAEMLL